MIIDLYGSQSNVAILKLLGVVIQVDMYELAPEDCRRLGSRY